MCDADFMVKLKVIGCKINTAPLFKEMTEGTFLRYKGNSFELWGPCMNTCSKNYLV
jgi:hypothetical protein